MSDYSNKPIKPCKYCGNLPKASDVGGINPYYEFTCGCDKGVVIDVPSHERVKAIEFWNALNEVNEDETE